MISQSSTSDMNQKQTINLPHAKPKNSESGKNYTLVLENAILRLFCLIKNTSNHELLD
jgi:hypothetical protein